MASSSSSSAGPPNPKGTSFRRKIIMPDAGRKRYSPPMLTVSAVSRAMRSMAHSEPSGRFARIKAFNMTLFYPTIDLRSICRRRGRLSSNQSCSRNNSGGPIMPYMSTRSVDYREVIDHLPEGAVLVLQEITWDAYEQLLDDLKDRPGVRITYDQGRIEIMSPLRKHEKYKEFI